jgi:glycerophosphoryl diester phosphodiesterase
MCSRPAADHPYYANSDFRIIAHRGGGGLGPENTMAVFRRGLAAGANVLEMDLRVTQDGYLVVLHDSTVNRTTDGSGIVREMTLAQIKKLDAGFRWTADRGQRFPFRNQGITVPTLTEVFEAFPRIPLVIEIKEKRPGICDPLCRMIREYRRTTSTLIASSQMDMLDTFRRFCPQVATSAGPPEALTFYVLSKLGLSSVFTPAMQALQIPTAYKGKQVATREFVAAAHRRNLNVEVWTVNDVGVMQQLINAGVDGIMTDYPDRLFNLLMELPQSVNTSRIVIPMEHLPAEVASELRTEIRDISMSINDDKPGI